MKKKHNEGFSLVEVLVAIVILAAFTIPTCASLVLSYRMNAKANEMLKAQLAVSSAVEQLMATGLTEKFHETLTLKEDTGDVGNGYTSGSFPGLIFEINLDATKPYYAVKVYDEEKNVEVETIVRNTDLIVDTEGGSGE